MQELAKMQIPGKEFLVDRALVTSMISRISFSSKWCPARAECDTDHHLVHCKLRSHFKPKPRKGDPPKKKFNLNKLLSVEEKADFQAGLQKIFFPETLWDQLRSVILQTSEEVVGFTTKKNKDCFNKNDLEIRELVAKKRSSHQAHLAQPLCHVRKTAFRHVQYRSAQVSRDPKWVVDQTCKENSSIRRTRWLYRLLQSTLGSVWPD